MSWSEGRMRLGLRETKYKTAMHKALDFFSFRTDGSSHSKKKKKVLSYCKRKVYPASSFSSKTRCTNIIVNVNKEEDFS